MHCVMHLTHFYPNDIDDLLGSDVMQKKWQICKLFFYFFFFFIL